MLVKIFERYYEIDTPKAALLIDRFELLLESLDEVFVIDNGGSVEIDLTSTHFELNLISFSDYLLQLPYDHSDADARRRLREIADQVEPLKLSANSWRYEHYKLKQHVQDDARAYLEQTIVELRSEFDLSQ